MFTNMAKPLTKEDQARWLLEYRVRTDDAIRELDRAKKQRVADYSERLRLLRAFGEQLYIKSNDAEQGELFDQTALLSEDLQALLDSPLNGLD